MYTSEKKHKTADRKGGGNPYGQPDRKISVFFLTTSLSKVKLKKLPIENG